MYLYQLIFFQFFLIKMKFRYVLYLLKEGEKKDIRNVPSVLFVVFTFPKSNIYAFYIVTLCMMAGLGILIVLIPATSVKPPPN